MISNSIKKLGIALMLAFAQNSWSESGLMQMTNTLIEYKIEGDILEAQGSSVQCQTNPANEELFSEYWVIAGLELSIIDPDYPEKQWVGLYAPAEEKFIFSASHSEEIPMGEVIYTAIYSNNWNVTWSEFEQTYVGSNVKNIVISWNLDSRTSTCYAVYSMRATGTPIFSIESIFRGSSIKEGTSLN